MKYFETHEATDKYKEQYVCGVDQLIKERQQYLAEKRAEYSKHLFANQEKYRMDLKKMLGWPLTEERETAIPEVYWEKLYEEGNYVVYRMQFKVIAEVYMTGLFFQNKNAERPLIIALHGGVGSPEKMAGFYGDTYNYNDLVERVLKFDCHVFAPQLLVWDNGSYNEYSISCNRNLLDSRLKRVGSSVTALEVYGIQRIMDYFETQTYVKNIGMIGFSYGGFYTVFTAAVDVRVKAAYSCGWYLNRTDRVDWSWMNSEEKFLDTEVVGLICPRKLWIGSPKQDSNADIPGGISESERVKELCKVSGAEWLKYFMFDADHEFCKDDVPIKEMVKYLEKGD